MVSTAAHTLTESKTCRKENIEWSVCKFTVVSSQVALGLGGPKDYQVAGQWFLLAANSGDIKAQDNLGILYQNGEGVRPDYVKAYMWFTLAAAQGHSEAAKHRDQIAQLMAPSQIEQARRLSSQKMYALIRCQIVSTLSCHWM